jgi:hypothetical protein
MPKLLDEQTKNTQRHDIAGLGMESEITFADNSLKSAARELVEVFG